MGVDDGVRIALQQLAANHQHQLLLVSPPCLAIVVVAELEVWRPQVQRRDVAQLLLSVSSSRSSALKKPRDVPELAERASRAGRSGTRATAARARTRD